MNRALLCLVILAVAVPAPAVFSKDPPRRTKSGKKSVTCPTLHSIVDCPDEGCGGQLDPDLNKQKNIHPGDDQQSVPRSIAWMKSLHDPNHFTAKNRSRDELKQTGEGQKITVVAWALAVRKGGKETCNCKLSAKADTDNHIVLVDPAIDNPTLTKNEKRDSETAEFTPRVRLDQHPNFTQEKLETLIDPDWSSGETPKEGKLLVRVTGILMFDSEHFLQHALKRHNNWEIHPVLKMEYCAEGDTCDETSANWKDLEAD
jgi:hypothetical protein